MNILKKIIVLVLVFSPISVFANINATNKWAWGEDIGWVNFDPAGWWVVVSGTGLTGTAWSSNFGWIDLAPTNGGVTLTNGVIATTCQSTLSWNAWSPNLGWIDFSGVRIDETGRFYGTTSWVNSGNISFSWSIHHVATSLLPDCTSVDSDWDGVEDTQEVIDGTDPNDSSSVLDSDNDGIPDAVDPNPNSSGDTLTDTDGDGVPDGVELAQGTNPNDGGDFRDTDGDGVPDYVEWQQGTDSNDPDDFLDTDGDGASDYSEEIAFPATDPNDSSSFPDGDGDGVTDALDPNPGTPGDTLIDTDGDGVPDVVETAQGTNPGIASNYQDSDGDGVPDYVEAQEGTDANDSTDFLDTDGDGVPDALDPNPGTPGDTLTDTDGDGVPDVVEINQNTTGTDPTSYQDSDGDGVPDYVEAEQGTDSQDSSDVLDTDGDGIPDALDPNPGTPWDILTDTDGDGVPDVVEQAQWTIPTDPTDFLDTDGDGVPDYVEGQQGTDSNDASDVLDTDGDDIPDHIDPNPTTWGDNIDSDGDGVPDAVETAQGTNPNSSVDFIDSDSDGVADFVESTGANGGDGDGDGVPDKDQQNVSGANNPVTGAPATLKSQGQCTFITENAFVAESSLAANDASADYPVGLVDFSVNCTTPGDSTNVTIYYDQVYNTTGWRYKKYDSSGNVYADITSIATFGTAVVGSSTVTTVTFTVTDGDPLTDEDGLVNGVINDPSGPAIPIVVNSGGWWGWSGRTRDYCPQWDISGDRYDGVCSEEELQEVVSVVPDTTTSSWTVIEDDESIEDTQNIDGESTPEGESWVENIDTLPDTNTENTIEKTLTNLQWEEVDYSLGKSYDSCPKIPAILDTQNITLEWIFSDIDESENPQIVANFKQAGIINGYEDGSFAPNSEISRTEFLKIVLKTHCLGYDDQDAGNLEFIDTDLSSWQARVIAKSQSLGIINGDILEMNRDLIDTNLGRWYDLERIEELKKVFKWLGLYSGEVNGYYTQDFVEAVYNFQIAEGVVSNQFQAGAGSWWPVTRRTFFAKYPETSYKVFRPNDVISKSEALKILMRMSNVSADDPQELLYADITTDWHIPYIRSAQTLGLFDPEADDFEFRPDDGVSRDTMVKLIDSLLRLYR